MIPVSDRWDAAVRSSGLVAARCEVWRSGVFTGTTLPVTGGTVRVDEGSNVRRALSASVDGSRLDPAAFEGLLSPVDTDLRVLAGFTYTDGGTELVPAGLFRLRSPARPSLRSHEWSLEGSDYAQVLADARFSKPWNVPRGQRVTAAIRAMVLTVLPWVEVVDLTGSLAVHPGGAFERDRWEAITTLADAIAADVGFDAEGRFVMRPSPVVKATPDWVVDYGTETAVLADAGQSWSIERVYNEVVATSSSSDYPNVVGVARQASGPFKWAPGFQRTRYYSSPVLRTNAQAAAAARSILARSIAVTDEVAPTVVPNPALEVGDTVHVAVPGRGLLARIVAGFTVPLGPGSMPLTLRTMADAVEIEGVG